LFHSAPPSSEAAPFAANLTHAIAKCLSGGKIVQDERRYTGGRARIALNSCCRKCPQPLHSISPTSCHDA
jgi:hypothetical protein